MRNWGRRKEYQHQIITKLIWNGERVKKLSLEIQNIGRRPFNITAYKLVKDIEIPQTRISEIIKSNRRITADTALRFSKYFGNSAKF